MVALETLIGPLHTSRAVVCSNLDTRIDVVILIRAASREKHLGHLGILDTVVCWDLGRRTGIVRKHLMPRLDTKHSGVYWDLGHRLEILGTTIRRDDLQDYHCTTCKAVRWDLDHAVISRNLLLAPRGIIRMVVSLDLGHHIDIRIAMETQEML